jgi:ABC-2 type transport system permease protein
MLKNIVKHEFRLLFREKTLWWVLIPFFALSLLAALNGKSWVRSAIELQQKSYSENAKEYDKYQQEFAEIESGKLVPNSEEPYVRDIRDSYEIGFYAKVTQAIPAAPLWNLNNGQADLYPSFYEINTRPRNELVTFAKTGELQNPVALMVGNFDLSFVLVYLFPLLIIALSFNLLSAERESGTLRLLLSQPLSLKHLIAGKLMPRMVLLIGLGFLLPFCTYFLSNIGTGNPSFSTGELLLRLFGWSALIALYGAFWFFVCVLIESFGRSSAYNAIAASAVWLFLAVLSPVIISFAAENLFPVPSRTAITQEIRKIEREINDESNFVRFQETLFSELDVRPVERVANERKAVLNDYAGRGELNRRIIEMETDLRASLDKRQVFVRIASFLSPPLLVQHLLNDLAGTNAERFQRFSASVGEFHQEWFAFFAKRFLNDEKISYADIQGFPQMEWNEDGFWNVLKNRSGEIIGLLAVTILAAFLSFRMLKSARL